MAKVEGAPAFTLNQLAAFVAVADAGTIAGAAEELHISASAVSASLSELERALRAQLVHRLRAKGIRLTPTGELLLPRARLLLHQASELEADARGTEAGVTGVVRVGCPPWFAPTVLPGLMAGFAERHPDARLDVSEATQDQLVAALAAGTLDLAIMYDLDLAPTWQRATFAHLRPMVVLPADHRLATDDDGGLDLADLADDPMVLLDAAPSANHAYDCCRRAGFAPKVAYRARTYETARSFVGRGLGWTLLVSRAIAPVSYEGRPLARREIATPALDEVGVCVAWHPDALLTRAARTFIAHVLRHGGELLSGLHPQES
ncbi:LysR substrate-binding domain-containing protein [Nocardioides sp. DS6]|uniref:LysR substrate-binding domain-containing protein n=1 Tax=Nocardioides eburneus TaxID=3231482 RepID=A0ABV3SZZ5_9ACTN